MNTITSAQNNVLYVVNTNRGNELFVEKMSELEYLKQIAWLTRRGHVDYELCPVFETLADEESWNKRFEEPLKWNELDEQDTLMSLSDDQLAAAGICGMEFVLGADRFGSWDDLFKAVYGEALTKSPDNTPSYFYSEDDAKAAIDEWSSEI